LGLLQISCIITNPFSDSPLWVKVKCLDIHILNLATHQTPHSNTPLPHTVSSRISQVMVLVHHICLEPQPWHHHLPIIQDLHHQCILSSANAFPITINSAKCPKSSRWRWWWWWWTTTTTTTKMSQQTQKKTNMWNRRT